MEETPHLSRHTTQSTDRTLTSSDHGRGQWSGHPQPKADVTPASQQDDTVWVEVPRHILGALLSNKLSQSNTVQLDPGLLGKVDGRQYRSAASNPSKIKAWIRKTKVGFDFRLRRKIDAERDEVIDASFNKDPSLFDAGSTNHWNADRKEDLKKISPAPLVDGEPFAKAELPASPADQRLSITQPVERHELDNTTLQARAFTNQATQELDGSGPVAELESSRVAESEKSPQLLEPRRPEWGAFDAYFANFEEAEPLPSYQSSTLYQRPNEDQLNFFPVELDGNPARSKQPSRSVDHAQDTSTKPPILSPLRTGTDTTSARSWPGTTSGADRNRATASSGTAPSSPSQLLTSPVSTISSKPYRVVDEAVSESSKGTVTPSRSSEEQLPRQVEKIVPRPGTDSDDASNSSTPIEAPENSSKEPGSPAASPSLSAETLQAIVAAAVRAELSKSEPSNDANRNQLDGLKLAKTTRYETETDAEPPSPSIRKKLPRNKNALQPAKRKRSVNFLGKNKMSAPSASTSTAEDSDVVLPKPLNDLQRRQTAGKRVAATAGPEAVWTAILRAQEKMLSLEDPLIWQARAAFGESRRNHHHDCPPTLLASLYESRSRAEETLGKVHPLVQVFLTNLETLEKLILADVTDELQTKMSTRNDRGDDDGALAPQSQALTSSPALTQPASPSVATKQSHGSLETPPLIESSSVPITRGQPNAQPGSNEDALPMPSSPPQSEHDRQTPPSAVHVPESLHELRTAFVPAVTNEVSPQTYRSSQPLPTEDQFWNAVESPHEPRKDIIVLTQLIFRAITQVAVNNILWLQRNYGPEPSVTPGKVRVRWTCSCGQRLFDDFEERREGAARELESFLNRPRAHHNGDPPSTPSRGSPRSLTGSSVGGSLQSQTSMTSFGSSAPGSFSNDAVKVSGRQSTFARSDTLVEPPWLLVCANEDRLTPKVTHLDMSPNKHHSDKDLAMTLRHHYFQLNKRWWRKLRLRGLTTIEFVQFECHINRFADIRKCPDMPDPSNQDYSSAFKPGDLIPPVGPTYLLHLFKHPEDYDDETCTRDRVPKRIGRLRLGVGWGIHLVEGFLAERVWLMVNTFFLGVSLVFAVAWVLERNDIQGAFGVAQWICMLSVCGTGYAQAWLA